LDNNYPLVSGEDYAGLDDTDLGGGKPTGTGCNVDITERCGSGKIGHIWSQGVDQVVLTFDWEWIGRMIAFSKFSRASLYKHYQVGGWRLTSFRLNNVIPAGSRSLKATEISLSNIRAIAPFLRPSASQRQIEMSNELYTISPAFTKFCCLTAHAGASRNSGFAQRS
jgi:hypothetical protein